MLRPENHFQEQNIKALKIFRRY